MTPTRRLHVDRRACGVIAEAAASKLTRHHIEELVGREYAETGSGH